MGYAFVGGGGVQEPGQGTSKAAPSLTVSTGDLIVVAVSLYFWLGSETITSVTDDLGNTYTQRKLHAQGSNTIAVYTAVSGSSGSCTCTVTISDARYISIASFNASGPDSGSLVNGTPTSADASSNMAPAAGSITTTVDGCLIVEVFGSSGNGTTLTPGSGFTNVYTNGGGSGMLILVAYKIQTSQGAINPDIANTANNTTPAGMIGIAFAPAAVASGNPYNYYAQQGA